jgi:hypothetical protein
MDNINISSPKNKLGTKSASILILVFFLQTAFSKSLTKRNKKNISRICAKCAICAKGGKN